MVRGFFASPSYIIDISDKTKAEIFATATAASATLEQCIKLFSRIRKAVERQKGLPDLLEKYSAEVSQTKTIVELIEDEEALKTPSVGSAVAKLNDVGGSLRTHLTTLATSKGPIQGFFKQLLSGEEGREKLEHIMRDLGDAKLTVSLHLQLSNVGLTRQVGQAVQVNIAAIEAMNKLLKERLGPGQKLRISQLLEGRQQNGMDLHSQN